MLARDRSLFAYMMFSFAGMMFRFAGMMFSGCEIRLFSEARG